MKILSITAQKPNSTGSGVYLTELVEAFDRQGHKQAVVAGVYNEDKVVLPDGVRFHPVYFCSENLPFPIVGMSDEMPYESTRYRDMTPEMVRQFKEAFLEVIIPAVEKFEPDVILCHHLYLLTAIVREQFPEKKIYGFCHNTDLRQMKKTDLERGYIASQIRKLDRIFVPQKAQEEGTLSIYSAEAEKITAIGMGYNSRIFYREKEKSDDGVTRIVFAGKIAQKKGVMSLIRSLSILPCGKEELKVMLAGGAGNKEEYNKIKKLAGECPYEVTFLGKLTQPELAKVYNESDIFVLPSFFDGLPLTVIEALACGDRVVMTDLPGIQEWVRGSIPGADVSYIKMPKMRNTDEPDLKELPEFEKRLALGLLESIRKKSTDFADVSGLSWEGIAKEVLCKL